MPGPGGLSLPGPGLLFPEISCCNALVPTPDRCIVTAMTYSATHIATVTKPAQRQLQEPVLRNNVENIVSTMNTRALAVRGWVIDVENGEDNNPWIQATTAGTEWAESKYQYVYQINFRITFAREDDVQPEPQELGAILRTLATKVTQPLSGRWQLTEVDGKPYTGGTVDSDDDGDAIGYAPVEIPEDFEDYFSHLFGLDAQIVRLRRAIEAGIMTDWERREHCVLYGPPGCGKSDVSQSLKRALGENAVMEYDATATTAAGAIKDLTEREILPRIIIIEEIEKAPEQAMTFLLGLMDLRASIRKTTARNSNSVIRDTKLFAIATVNNTELFQKLQAGALASRFSNRIKFNRPSREQLAMILRREIEKMGDDGDMAWIDPTLDYCEGKEINDPRRVTSVCLCGREMLLTGEYQKLLTDTEGDLV